MELNHIAAAAYYKKVGKELARETPDLETAQPIKTLVAELEQKLRQIDG
jgi:hypothetical protein